MYTIYYKNWLGVWTKDESSNDKNSLIKRLKFIRKNKALNGQCDIFSN